MRAVLATLDAGELPLGGGLLALLRPALEQVGPDGVVAVFSSARSVREDLPSWCRIERHDYLGVDLAADGRDRHLVARGPLGVARPMPDPLQDLADPHTGFAPRGARVEPGGPPYPFTLLGGGHLAAAEAGPLYQQAAAAQWDGNRDIPWERLPRLPQALEAAVAQVMTFLAMNEFSALYVPARFLPRIHPAHAEVALFLATQMADEARHIDVFLRRARAARGERGIGIAPALTSHSLHSLLVSDDFSEATFLLSVLGEGTFLDLLRYLEDHAPDEVTAEVARRARADEARHVHFGLLHIRHALRHEPALYGRLEAAVRRRAAGLHGGVPAPVQDALTIYAARGTDPEAIARGHEAFRELLDTMHRSRVKRLQHAGFTDEQAERLSALHTPNFM